jgi:hypothetical protein
MPTIGKPFLFGDDFFATAVFVVLVPVLVVFFLAGLVLSCFFLGAGSFFLVGTMAPLWWK